MCLLPLPLTLITPDEFCKWKDIFYFIYKYTILNFFCIREIIVVMPSAVTNRRGALESQKLSRERRNAHC